MGGLYHTPGRGAARPSYVRSEKHLVGCRRHTISDSPRLLSTSTDFPGLSLSRTLFPRARDDMLGSLTQLRRDWVPPRTRPLPLGASVSSSMCFQAWGPGLRGVHALPAGLHPGHFLCPTSARTSPCQAPRLHVWEGRPASGDTPVPLCPDVGLAGCWRRQGQDGSSNPNVPQTCCVTSGRSLHISEPQFLPLEYSLPCKGLRP